MKPIIDHITNLTATVQSDRAFPALCLSSLLKKYKSLLFSIIVITNLIFLPITAYCSASNLTGDWRMNANGWDIKLKLQQGSGNPWVISSPNKLTGFINNDRIEGYYASGEGTAVLVRFHEQTTRPIQVYIGSIDASGTNWSGKFYALDSLYGGASQQNNIFGFKAVKGASAFPVYTAPDLGQLGEAHVDDCYTIYNRPSEFGLSQPGLFKINLGSFINYNGGHIDGELFGSDAIGYYSQRNGTIVLLRIDNNRPSQVFIGQQHIASELIARGFAGIFYALNEGMGASPSRMTFDWNAVNDYANCNQHPLPQ